MAIASLDRGEPGAGYRPLADINVTPFVDVMLVLLIIFMVAAPLMIVGVPVDLPRTSAAKLSQSRQPVIVSVSKDGKVFVGEQEARVAELPSRLAELRTKDPNATVYVRGDRSIAYGRVMEIMGQVGQAGFARVSLIGEASPARKTQ
jgi:biopolymer transport protein TolR